MKDTKIKVVFTEEMNIRLNETAAMSGFLKRLIEAKEKIGELQTLPRRQENMIQHISHIFRILNFLKIRPTGRCLLSNFKSTIQIYENDSIFCGPNGPTASIFCGI